MHSYLHFVSSFKVTQRSVLTRSESKIWATLLNNVKRHTILVALEVFRKLNSELFGLHFVLLMGRPALDGAENFGIDTEHILRYFHTEAAHSVGL